MQSTASLLHVGAAVLALLCGALVLSQRKGTRRHRQLGHVYVASMLALNLSSFFVFSLTGRASLFHGLAMFSLATVVAGFLPAFLRRPRGGWLEMHMQFMAWSYVGLLAAAAAEAAVRIPKAPFWWAVALASAAVIGAGGVVIGRRLPALRARYGSLQRPAG